MSLIGLILTLIVIGLIVGMVNRYGPREPFNLPGWIITTINVIAAVCVIIWLLYLVGLLPLNGPRVPRLQ